MADFVMPVETQPSPSLSGQSFMGYLIDHVPQSRPVDEEVGMGPTWESKAVGKLVLQRATP